MLSMLRYLFIPFPSGFSNDVRAGACTALHSIASHRTQGYAFVEFVERTEAEQAQLYLDGGQVGLIMCIVDRRP